MPLYVIDPEAVLQFRRNHRGNVQRQRRAARKKNAEKPRERKQYDEIDRQWLRAIELDRT